MTGICRNNEVLGWVGRSSTTNGGSHTTPSEGRQQKTTEGVSSFRWASDHRGSLRHLPRATAAARKTSVAPTSGDARAAERGSEGGGFPGAVSGWRRPGWCSGAGLSELAAAATGRRGGRRGRGLRSPRRREGAGPGTVAEGPAGPGL